MVQVPNFFQIISMSGFEKELLSLLRSEELGRLACTSKNLNDLIFGDNKFKAYWFNRFQQHFLGIWQGAEPDYILTTKQISDLFKRSYVQEYKLTLSKYQREVLILIKENSFEKFKLYIQELEHSNEFEQYIDQVCVQTGMGCYEDHYENGKKLVKFFLKNFTDKNNYTAYIWAWLLRAEIFINYFDKEIYNKSIYCIEPPSHFSSGFLIMPLSIHNIASLLLQLINDKHHYLLIQFMKSYQNEIEGIIQNYKINKSSRPLVNFPYSFPFYAALQANLPDIFVFKDIPYISLDETIYLRDGIAKLLSLFNSPIYDSEIAISILHLAAQKMEWKDFVKLSRQLKLPITIEGSYGILPLHTAIYKGNINLVKSMLKYYSYDFRKKNIFFPSFDNEEKHMRLLDFTIACYTYQLAKIFKKNLKNRMFNKIVSGLIIKKQYEFLKRLLLLIKVLMNYTDVKDNTYKNAVNYLKPDNFKLTLSKYFINAYESFPINDAPSDLTIDRIKPENINLLVEEYIHEQLRFFYEYDIFISDPFISREVDNIKTLAEAYPKKFNTALLISSVTAALGIGGLLFCAAAAIIKIFYDEPLTLFNFSNVFTFSLLCLFTGLASVSLTLLSGKHIEKREINCIHRKISSCQNSLIHSITAIKSRLFSSNENQTSLQTLTCENERKSLLQADDIDNNLKINVDEQHHLSVSSFR